MSNVAKIIPIPASVHDANTLMSCAIGHTINPSNQLADNASLNEVGSIVIVSLSPSFSYFFFNASSLISDTLIRPFSTTICSLAMI
ncbi:hypothetical protein [uncultured Dubosiella sp.]|uniref:hypothetical protein n=1 Tax=uncultured Dubosiella sp. TaxID=1937011 RepID=UPI0027313EE0|nr:hypothetical protein [uncultured Dubosiella sp.]